MIELSIGSGMLFSSIIVCGTFFLSVFTYAGMNIRKSEVAAKALQDFQEMLEKNNKNPPMPPPSNPNVQ